MQLHCREKIPRAMINFENKTVQYFSTTVNSPLWKLESMHDLYKHWTLLVLSSLAISYSLLITDETDTDEIPGFLLLLKSHIFTARSEDTIFIFHVWGYWCGHGYQDNYPITMELLAHSRGRLIWNFIHKMTSRCEAGRVIELSSSSLEFWLFRTKNISIIFFISPL